VTQNIIAPGLTASQLRGDPAMQDSLKEVIVAVAPGLSKGDMEITSIEDAQLAAAALSFDALSPLSMSDVPEAAEGDRFRVSAAGLFVKFSIKLKPQKFPNATSAAAIFSSKITSTNSSTMTALIQSKAPLGSPLASAQSLGTVVSPLATVISPHIAMYHSYTFALVYRVSLISPLGRRSLGIPHWTAEFYAVLRARIVRDKRELR
jgi:hypothetical protein